MQAQEPKKALDPKLDSFLLLKRRKSLILRQLKIRVNDNIYLSFNKKSSGFLSLLDFINLIKVLVHIVSGEVR